MREPHLKELSSVMALDAPRRYEHFIDRVADTTVVWGLFHAGWASVVDEAGRPSLRLWPHAAYARLCAVDELARCVPKSLPLEELLEKLLPELARIGSDVAAFLLPTDKGVVVSASELAADLRARLEEYD